MSATNKTTFVISVVGGEDDEHEGKAELDWEAPENLDEDGSLKSSFLPGEEAVFLVNSPPGYHVTEVRVHSKCGGGYLEPGTVDRDLEESAGFDSQSTSTDLSYWPKTAPIVDLYTVPSSTMSYGLSNRTLSPAEEEELPVEALISYSAECQQVRYSPPGGLELENEEDVFPVRIEIVIEKQ